MNVFHDSRIGLPALLAALLALSCPLGASTIGKTIEKDTITVTAEGLGPTERFALVFSREAGSITGWYDLCRDPGMKTNLCARGGANPFALFQNRMEMMVDGKEVSLFPGRAEEFSVAESDDVRVVVRMAGRFTTPSGEFPGEKEHQQVMEFAGRDLKGPQRPRYDTRFTIYPTGRVFIRHVMEVQGLRVIRLSSNRMVLATAPASDVKVLNDWADEREAFLKPASFILHSGGGDALTGSALLVADYQKYPTDWLGQLMMMDGQRKGFLRSAFMVTNTRGDVQPGKYVWNFMLQVEPSNVDSRESARLYALDYLEPAHIGFPSGLGSMELRDLEDRQMDGFSEGSGCYVMNAEGKPGVCVLMDAGMQSRFCPVFEVRGWSHGTPRSLRLDDTLRRIGVHYDARVSGRTLLVQFLGVLSPGKHTIEIEGSGAGNGAEN